MKQVYIIHENHPKLLLFFAGWAADETPFSHYRPQGMDFMLCYDYRTLNFDASLLQGYTEIHVVGWSMGVWAASHVVPTLGLNIGSSTAINGTPFPIDERRGIPPVIFRGTLEGLTGASLHKFLRRMCADSAAFRDFLSRTPRRPLEEVRDELDCIARQYAGQPQPTLKWTEAIVGSNDRIIPPANQLNAWNELGTVAMQTEDAHYQESLFKHYLQDRWTNN
ncbi:alpha/beta fold hydrolase [Bacteroides ndongoniae]|uniref:DUF452 family protein n=1 Tax=Bacteroides ndongoniae TaxID=1903262 RepID=UPI0023F713AE|nr:alpha/beta fold hydrolase [Bacteroides ndongoniae]